MSSTKRLATPIGCITDDEKPHQLCQGPEDFVACADFDAPVTHQVLDMRPIMPVARYMCWHCHEAYRNMILTDDAVFG